MEGFRVASRLKSVQQQLPKLLRHSKAEKNAIEETSLNGHGSLFTVFITPKKDGVQRPVINLNGLNKFVNTEHFKIEDIHTLRDLLRAGD